MTEDLDRPFHTAQVAHHPVRIFGLEHGLLWISLADICRAANLSRMQRDRAKEMALAAKGDTAEEQLWVTPKRVVTADGEELVLSQVATCGLVGALIGERVIPQTFAGELRDACEEAIVAVFHDAPPAGAIERVRTISLVMFDGARPSQTIKLDRMP